MISYVVVGSLASVWTVSAAAQGLAQVNVAGIPPILQSPALSDLAMQLEQGRFPVTFIFNSPDRQPAEFVFRIRLERDGQAMLDLTSDPVRYVRGVYTYATLDAEPPIAFAAGYHEIVDALSTTLGQDLDQTGLLSEGLYTLTVDAIPTDRDQLVVSVPGSAVFEVQYLEPPVLVSPAMGAILDERLPLFTWLPVLGGPPGTLFDYEFLLVEVYPEQEPVQALEANRPVEATVLSGATTLPYTVDRLPLEPGKQYAWQVTARDAGGLIPFTDSGRSEIATFVFAPLKPALADWTYPFSRPAISFNLGDAELRHDGFQVHGHYEGRAGRTPLTAVFDRVVLDLSTQEIVSGTITLMGEQAESVGVVESDASRHVLLDDTGPSVPFVTARVGSAADVKRLDVTIGPSMDPESGVRNVLFRLAPVGEGGNADGSEEPADWFTAFASGQPGEEYPGGSYRVDVPVEYEQLLLSDRLRLQVRLANGLGLEATAETIIGAGTDISPPLVVKPTVTYSGYYDPDRPNSVEISAIRVSDPESRIRSIEYRVVSPGPDAVEETWKLLASPGALAHRTGTVVIDLPPLDRDSAVVIEFRTTNEALLSTVWNERVDVDIDETGPVQAGPVARFVASESDPRIEILRDAVADYQSGVRRISYRVVDDQERDRSYVDWSVFPPGSIAEVKRTQLNFTTQRAVRVELRVANGAGLETTIAESVVVPELRIGDRTPPSAPAVSLRVLRSEPGAETVLELSVGSSDDLETGISRVQYRIEDPRSGASLTGWSSVAGVSDGDFAGSTVNVVLQPSREVASVRAIVRVVNGAGAARVASATAAIAAEDLTPPEVQSIQVYVQDGRILAFVDGMVDTQSTVARLDYRILASGGVPLTEWTESPLVPAGRSSYGRQLLRADVPAAAAGEIRFQLRVVNGAGLETVVEETVSLER